MIRALIFDFDGTVVDTELPTFIGWQHTYSTHGQTLSLEEYSLVVGTDYGIFNPRTTLEKRIGRTLDWKAIDAQRRSHYYKLIEENEILPGVKRLLDEASARGIPCAVASSSPIDWVKGHLERLKLLHYFGFLSCAGDQQKPKPAPDVYLGALKHLGAAATETVAIEDSPNGVMAARTAGIPCVIVPNAITRGLQFPPGYRLLTSLEGISLETLQTHANQ